MNKIVDPKLSRLKAAYSELDNIFTDKEAWGLFRIAAVLETIGWSILIIGIICSEGKLPGDTFMLPIGGSIHGILYLFYLFIVIFAHRSMHWGIVRFLIAVAVSVVPFGALVFEIYVGKERARNKMSKEADASD